MVSKSPKLSLVGAGPGDPDLITLKGIKVLRSADVVLYDALVDPSLLEFAKGAEHILVGKRAGRVSVSQKTINRLIVEKLHTKGHVVRLKGGDPFVFARGFEEITYAQQFGIETEVVVGISSIMLPGHYGIPLTCRGINQSFTALTATTSEGHLSNEVISAAKHSPTAIIFMGLNKLDLIVEAYLKEGRANLPVAIISNGTVSQEEVIAGDVKSILAIANMRRPKAPALLVFGEGAANAQINYSTSETILNTEIA